MLTQAQLIESLTDGTYSRDEVYELLVGNQGIVDW